MILKDPIVPRSRAKKADCVLQSGSTHRDKMSVKCSFTAFICTQNRLLFPSSSDRKVTQTMRTQPLCYPSDNRCRGSSSEARGRNRCREERELGGGGSISLAFSGVLLPLMDYVWVRAVITSNKIKSNLHLMKSLILSLYSIKKLLKLEHVSSSINILCTHNKIFNNWPFCLLRGIKAEPSSLSCHLLATSC